jgi:hypothetical protein
MRLKAADILDAKVAVAAKPAVTPTIYLRAFGFTSQMLVSIPGLARLKQSPVMEQ